MSTADWTRPAETQVPPRRRENNGTRPARKRAVRPASTEPGIAPAPLADFATLEARPVDAEKWPVYPVVWWQPELALEVPHSSTLRNERRHKVPLPGFLNLQLILVSGAAGLHVPSEPILPDVGGPVPLSDLAPLGWDPRVDAKKREGGGA